MSARLSREVLEELLKLTLSARGQMRVRPAFRGKRESWGA
jgi:hypothetical protein